MYVQFILVLLFISILTLSVSKYKEGQCVQPNSPEGNQVATRVRTINARLSDQTNILADIRTRMNDLLTNYSDFKFSVNGVNINTANGAKPSMQIDPSSTLSNPGFIFTLILSPNGEKGDPGNQGYPGLQGSQGDGGNNGFPGYWGSRGGCYD
jgi:hypothetical protein